MMVMVKHDQIYGLLGDLSFATIERGAKKSIHHLDQRGGPYDGVELVENQRFERVKLLFKEAFGTRQPFISFPVMVTLVLGVSLGGKMIMVPRQHEKISGRVRNHCTECSINRFRLCKRDDNVIDMCVNGLQRIGNGGAGKIFDHG